ncbi:flagellar hook-basal body complex protein FliE [Clostridium carnis]
MKINGFIPSENIFSQDINKKDNIKSNNFRNILKENLDKLNEKQVESDNMNNDLIMGKKVDLHEVMLSTEEAKMSLQLAVQVRNKVVEAVQELTRMQL